eukprot:4103605-Pleurochrysis_carterae.AAC.2
MRKGSEKWSALQPHSAKHRPLQSMAFAASRNGASVLGSERLQQERPREPERLVDGDIRVRDFVRLQNEQQVLAAKTQAS